MKTIETSTSLIPIFSVAMYETQLNPDYLLEGGLDELDDKLKEKYWDLFDNNLYEEHILECAVLFMEEIQDQLIGLDLGIENIKVQKIHSPKEYNFANDTLYFDLNVVNDFDKRLIKWLKANESNKDFLEFIEDHYSSRSGFISFTRNTVEGLIEQVSEDIENASGAILHYLVDENKGINEEMFNELVNRDLCYNEFIEGTDDGETLNKAIDLYLLNGTDYYEAYDLMINKVEELNEVARAGYLDSPKLLAYIEKNKATNSLSTQTIDRIYHLLVCGIVNYEVNEFFGIEALKYELI